MRCIECTDHRLSRLDALDDEDALAIEERQPAHDLVLPVEAKGGRADDEQGPVVVVVGGDGDGLNRFAEAHFSETKTIKEKKSSKCEREHSASWHTLQHKTA